MDDIFLKCLLVLKVKGRGSEETVDGPGCAESQFVAEHRDLWGWGASGPIWGEGDVRGCSEEDSSV